MAERKAYHTRTREHILQCLAAHRDTPVSASELLCELLKGGVTASESTVYRYLSALCDNGQVIRYVAEKGEGAVYQFTGSDTLCADHLHLKCRECGRLIHLDCHFMDEVSEHLLSDHGFSLICEGSVLYGICRDCRGKAEV